MPTIIENDPTVDYACKQVIGNPSFPRLRDMIQKTPEQRRQYEDRLRAERDEKARLQAAIEEGEARGEARGKSEEKASTIRLLQGLLMQELTSVTELQTQSLEELDHRIADLKLLLRNRIS